MWFFRHLIALALLLDAGDSFVNSRHHRASINQPTHPTETVLHLLQKDNDVQVADVCLLRHGESTFNALNRFCGWADVPLTEKGEEEARAAGRLIRDDPLMMGNVDVIFTSNLVRAHSTASLIAAELEGGRAQQGGGSTSTAIVQDWRLNEQMYGALTGLNKRQAMVEFGFQQVHRWRRGLAEAPPSKLFGAEWSFSSATRPGCASHERFSKCEIEEQMYEEQLEGTESFMDISNRVHEFWVEKVVPECRAGRRVAIVGHGNMLRALLQRLETMPHKDVVDLTIPRCTPIHYRFSTPSSPSIVLSPTTPQREGEAKQEAASESSVALEIVPFPEPAHSDYSPLAAIQGRMLLTEDEVAKRLLQEKMSLSRPPIAAGPPQRKTIMRGIQNTQQQTLQHGGV